MLLEIKMEKSISNEINSKTVDECLWPEEVPLFGDVAVFFRRKKIATTFSLLLYYFMCND